MGSNEQFVGHLCNVFYIDNVRKSLLNITQGTIGSNHLTSTVYLNTPQVPTLTCTCVNGHSGREYLLYVIKISYFRFGVSTEIAAGKAGLEPAMSIHMSYRYQN